MQSAADQTQALIVLNALPRVGPVTIRRLLDYFQNDPLRVLEATDRDLRRVPGVGQNIATVITEGRKTVDLARQLDLIDKFGAKVVTLLDEGYPALLREIYDAPLVLYVLGACPLDMTHVAFVGTRRSTLYGRANAKKLAAGIARAGHCVVSGMARGIDSAAHEGALDVGGKTIAVLGNGADIIYPPENGELYRRIIEHGAIVSEFPFGQRADKQSFPRRNRVISGMSRAIVVVESAQHGGSMITAQFATDQGRTVFAVPGRIDQASSAGCHHLIREGATLCTSAQDILEDLSYSRQLELPTFGEPDPDTAAVSSDATANDDAPDEANGPRYHQLPPGLGSTEQEVATIFAEGGIHAPDAIAGMTGLTISQATATITLLEIKRLLARRADGKYEIRV